MQVHTPQGIRDATPEEETSIKAAMPADNSDDIKKLIEYARKQGWI